MGERTTRFCDTCEKTIDHGRGFTVVGEIIPLGADGDRRHINGADYCPTCLGKKLGMTPDVLRESDLRASRSMVNDFDFTDEFRIKSGRAWRKT